MYVKRMLNYFIDTRRRSYVRGIYILEFYITITLQLKHSFLELQIFTNIYGFSATLGSSVSMLYNIISLNSRTNTVEKKLILSLLKY